MINQAKCRTKIKIFPSLGWCWFLFCPKFSEFFFTSFDPSPKKVPLEICLHGYILKFCPSIVLTGINVKSQRIDDFSRNLYSFEGSNSWFTELVMRHQVLPWLLLKWAYAQYHSLLFKILDKIAKIILQKCQMSDLSWHFRLFNHPKLYNILKLSKALSCPKVS